MNPDQHAHNITAELSQVFAIVCTAAAVIAGAVTLAFAAAAHRWGRWPR